MTYPYKGTKVSVEASQTEINRLLQKYHIEGVQWTTVWSSGEIELKFPISVTSEGARKKILVKLKPPVFIAKRRTYEARKGYVIVEAPDYMASMRALFYYLKSMLEAQAYGLARMEEIFMSYIVTSLEGHESTLGDQLKAQIARGDIPALEAHP